MILLIINKFQVTPRRLGGGRGSSASSRTPFLTARELLGPAGCHGVPGGRITVALEWFIWIVNCKFTNYKFKFIKLQKEIYLVCQKDILPEG